MKKIFTSLLVVLALMFSVKAVCVPILSSYPSATATIFLDFDGHYVQSSVWNNGNPINCAASGLTEAQMTEAFHRAAEDFRPFDVNITTDEALFLSRPLNQRVRIIITATSSWMTPGYGGVAYIGSFTWGDDTPAFVFSDRHGYSPKKVGETISHESGHTVGLSHQSKYNGTNCNTPQEEYNSGFGSGETGWAPIMGNSLARNFSNWNNGPTPYGCTNTQDNLSIITTQNGFGYRQDDFSDALNAGTHTLQGSGFNINGVITTNTDKDAFKFTIPVNGSFYLSAIPFNVAGNWIGANLDIRIELYNASQTLIRDFDPLNTLSNIIDTMLTAGTYYIRLYGTGNANIGPYGSLGSYTITGSFSGLPIHDISLGGTVDKGKHNLSWKIIADEPIKSIQVESSANGTSFGPLTSVAATTNKFAYQPYQNSTVFYRLKVTSVLDETKYSNTIALRGVTGADKLFNVSTLVQNDIVINAAENYQYILHDVNGRMIQSGKGLKGINRVEVTGQSKGMYIIQLISNDNRQTERIIKQ
jgi:hypothetical protein